MTGRMHRLAPAGCVAAVVGVQTEAGEQPLRNYVLVSCLLPNAQSSVTSFDKYARTKSPTF